MAYLSLSSFIKNLAQKIWARYFYLTLGISFILFFPIFWTLISRPKWHSKAYWLRSKLCRIFLTLHFIRIKKKNTSGFYPESPVIICSNHYSDIDILVLLAAFPGQYAFLGKQALAELPLFGRFFRKLDIAVDRQNPHKASSSYKQALKRLEAGQGVVIFPEGGILDDREELKPFKTGAFTLSSRTGIPIQPLTIQNSGRILWAYEYKGHPGKIPIIIHKPVYPGNKSVEELRDEIFEIINNGRFEKPEI